MSMLSFLTPDKYACRVCGARDDLAACVRACVRRDYLDAVVAPPDAPEEPALHEPKRLGVRSGHTLSQQAQLLSGTHIGRPHESRTWYTALLAAAR